jgi:hypothetical protein
MGLRDEEYDPTDRQKHQAELRKQLLRKQLLRAEKPEVIGKKAEDKPKGKGKHRKQ